MSRRLSFARLALVFAATLVAAWPALALEPITVTSEGVIAAGSATEPPPRDAAFRAALVAAVVEASRTLIPPERFSSEAERLRAQLEPQAQTFVLTYRVTGALRKRAAALDPEIQEWVLPVTARIDTVQLRAFLVRTGFLREAGERPSLVYTPMVIEDGWRPESPTPYAHANTSCVSTLSGVLPARPKKSRSMPAYAFTVRIEPERCCFSARKA